MKLLWPLLMQLGWQRVIIVTDTECDVLEAPETSSGFGFVQHVLVRGSQAVSGHWVKDVVKTGVDSWQPIYVLLVCSLTCVSSALHKASELERELGTQTAFAMTSRWLLVATGSDQPMNHILVNITMDNVAVVELLQETKARIHTLMWTKQGRRWTRVRDNVLNNWQLPAANSTITDAFHTGQGNSAAEQIDTSLFPNVKNGFNGRHLNVITKEWLSYTKSVRRDNVTKVWSGLLLDLLELVSHTLNFTYDLVEPEDGQWGTGTAIDPDVGLYGQVISKRVDLGLAPTDIIHSRSLLMDYSHPVVFTHVVMVYKKPRRQSKWWMLFNPLSAQLVQAMGGSFLGVTFCICILEKITISQNWKSEGPSTMSRTIGKVLTVTAGALLSKPTELFLRSGPAKTLLWSWWMLSLVLAAAYSGTLTAFLSVSKESQLFSSSKDLLTKQHDFRWGTIGGTALDVLLQTSNETTFRELWAGIQRFASRDPDVISSDVETVAAKVREGKFVMFQSDRFVVEVFGGDCDVEIVNAAIKQTLTAVVLPKGSALTQPISNMILRLHSSGVLSHWRDKWFPRAVCPLPTAGPVVISLSHVQGVLLMMPVGIGLALGVIVMEALYRRIPMKGTEIYRR